MAMNSIRRPQRGRSGFSLLEMLVSIGILALLMTTLAFHTFSLTQIWRDDTDHDFYSNNMPKAWRSSSMPPFSAPPRRPPERAVGAAAAAGGGTVEWARPPDWGETRDPLLFFRLYGGPRRSLSWKACACPDVNCYNPL